ncbi:MAG TPA: hypothetical protein DHW11_04420 [Gemmatimonadetes bacterium]|nr:hypothetical protein [Gemmatimonadota bacterium]
MLIRLIAFLGLQGFLCMSFVLGTHELAGQTRATVAEERIALATYPYSDANPIPVLTQDPRLYPYHKFEGYAHESELREWTVVTLENDWIEVWVLPEVGGKVWGARVKATGHEFIYRNEVMKFRNIALRGPWTSGGIEFNFGVIGHTPSTASPVDYLLSENDDGSASVFVGAMDLPSRTRWRVEIRLPADRAYFETHAQWQNPTPLEHPYYNWMTGAAFAKDDLVLSIPGNAYLEHPGAEQSWPVDPEGRFLPAYDQNRFGGNKSYHVVGSHQDFFGGYFEDEDYGFGHWGRYEEMPGQKLWLWALSRHGGIWEDLLTDTDGQYIEFQAGRLLVQYSPSGDVNPISEVGFSPGSSDRWTETWFPVERLGGLTEASREGALYVERIGTEVLVRAHSFVAAADTLVISVGGDTVLTDARDFNVLEPVSWSVEVPEDADVVITLGALGLHYDSDPQSKSLDRPFQTPPEAVPSIPWADRNAEAASELVQGRRLAEARHTYEEVLDAEPWHREALLGLADLEFRRGLNSTGLLYARRALQLDAYDTEANFLAGNLYLAAGKVLDAHEAFGWAARGMQYRSVSYQQLAKLEAVEGDWKEATRYANMALDYDVYALPAYHILAVSARAEGDSLRASNALERIEEIDPMSHIPFAEHWLAEDRNEARAELRARFRGEFPGQEIIELGLAYAAVGRMGEARAVMSLADGTSVEPLTRAWIAHSAGNVGDLGAPASVDFVFPFRREMLPVLTWAADNTDHWGWRYLLALVLAARDRPLEAANELRAIGLKPDYAPVYTTRALLVNDDEADRERDLRYAVELNPDERLLRIPLIQHLQAARNWDEAVRASGSALEIFPRDFDLALLHVRSLNELERYEESIRIMHDIQVLPSEHSLGAHQLFADAEVMAGLVALERGELEVANDHFFMAMTWPERLGQGRPYSPEERLPRFLLALSRWLSDDSEGASRAWTAVVDATPDSVFWGESATRLDLLGALSLEALGRQEELKSFGDVGVGALAPVANQVRAASRAGESVALAVAATTAEIDEIFDDVQGRLIQKVLGFASQVVH